MSRRTRLALVALAFAAASLVVLTRRPVVPERPRLPAPAEAVAAAPVPAWPPSTPPAPSGREARKTDPLAGMSMGITACPPGSAADFAQRDRNVTAFFDEKGVALSMVGRDPSRPGRRRHSLRWGVEDVAEVEPRAEDEGRARVNRFVGDPSLWTRDEKTYGTVVYDEIRPGVDLRVESRPHAYKYTVTAERGRDVENLRFRYEGARAVRVVEDGAALEIETSVGALREDGLRCWQDLPEGRRAVEARYVASGRDGYEISFSGHDPDAPLTIDPVLHWSGFLGGAQSPQGDDQANAIAVDGAGNAYVAGYTYCLNFPATAGAEDTTHGGDADAFLVKLDAGGALQWATYLGGVSSDYGNGVAYDPATGSVILVGYTQSDDFPATPGSFDPIFGGSDGFVAKFETGAGRLDWASFVGGSGYDGAQAVAVDGSGEIYVVGFTGSPDFPTLNASDGTLGGGQDGFVTCVKFHGQGLNWSTYLGGGDTDQANGVAVSGTAVYVTGYTLSTDFPTPGALYPFLSGGQDGFLGRFGLGGTLQWSTYLGGSGEDTLNGVAVTNGGEPVVVGHSASFDYPLLNAFDNTLDGFNDVVVTRVKNTGGALVWSTFLGGYSSESGNAVAAGTFDSVLVTGSTFSIFGFNNFPTTAGAYRTAGVGSSEAFAARLGPGGGLNGSTFLAGSLYDQGRGIASTASGVYVAGGTYSADFPQPSPPAIALPGILGGLSDGFALQLAPNLSTLNSMTFIGGSLSPADDFPQAVAAANEADVVYVAGYTYALDFPVTVGAEDTVMDGPQDGFVTRVRYAGQPFIEWSTYLGGTFTDTVYGIAVDSNDHVYVTGYTNSFDFPLRSPWDSTLEGTDAFLTQLDRDGRILYSTFVGGNSTDFGRAVAVDAGGNAYVVGHTYSNVFPLINAFDPTLTGSDADGFIVKIKADGFPEWSTYLGGSGFDSPTSVSVSAGGEVYVAGLTISPDFIVTATPDPNLGSASFYDAFVTAVRTDGVLRWSRYLGDTQDEVAYAVAVDASNTYVYVTGYTLSPGFPTLNAQDPTFSGSVDAFLTRLNPANGTLVWSTFFGGSSHEYGQGLDVDDTGDVYVTGQTLSFDFPLKGAFQTIPQGNWDAFAAKAYAAGGLAWSTLIGGSGADYGFGISVAPLDGAVYVAGQTTSADFPITPPTWDVDEQLAPPSDGFLLRINNAAPNPPDFSFMGSGQFKQDGTTLIPVGGWTRQASFFLRARATDSDDDPVALEVEAKPIGTPFNGTGFVTGGFVASGALAQITLPFPSSPLQLHYQVRVRDATGRVSSWLSFGANPETSRDIGYDNVAQAALFTAPTTGADHHTQSASIGLAGTASDDASGVASVSYFNLANGASGGASGTSTWTVASIPLLGASAPAGGVTNTIRITTTDFADNSIQTQINVIRDNTPPTVSITSPAPPLFVTNASSLSLSGNAADTAPGLLNTVAWTNSLGGGGAASVVLGTWSASVTGLSPGDNVITVTATDRAGNSTQTQITIRRDTTNPTIAISAPAANFTTAAGSVMMTGSASDNVALAGTNPVTWRNLTTGSAPAAASGSTSWSVASATLTLTEGPNVLQVTATDSVGLTSSASVTVFRDLGNPSVTITLPASDPFNTGSNTVALSGNASDGIAVVSVRWDNAATGGFGFATLSAPNTPSTGWNVASIPLNAGSNLITVTARDRVDNTSTDTIQVNLNVTAPSLVVTSPAATPFVTASGTVLIQGSAADDAGVTSMTAQNTTTGLFYPVNTSVPLPSPPTPPNPAFTWDSTVTLQPGSNSVTISASDGVAVTPVVLTIIYDAEDPAVKITGPTTADTLSTGLASIALAGTASDNRGVVEVRWANSAGGSGVATGTSPSWSVASIPLFAGPQTITVTAEDEAGNETTDDLVVTLDTSLPDVAITAPSVAGTFTTTAGTVNIGGTVSDNFQVGTVTWSNAATGASGAATLAAGDWTAAGLALNPGSNLITVVATDAAGNLRTDTIIVRQDALAPAVSIASPSAGPSFKTSSGTVLLAGSASDDVEVASVAWSNSAGGSGTADGTTSWSVPSLSLSPGDNDITVTVTDVVGRVNTDLISIHYDDNAPAVAITSPAGPSASTTGTPIDLGGTATDTDGEDVAVPVSVVEWENLTTGGFGTATLAAGAWNAAVPLTSGLNTVRITATDAAGNASTAQILVTYDPAAPLVTILVPTTDLNISTSVTPVTVAGLVTDDVGVAGVTWASSGAVVPSTGPASLAGTDWSASIPLAPGPNVVTITATDTVGRTGTRRITITYDPTNPSVSITTPTSSPTFLTTVTPLSLGGSATDNLSVQSVSWSNAATTESGTATGTGLWTAGGINLAPGVNTITVTARDAVGNTGTAQIVVTYDGLPPTVAITTPGVDPFPTQTRPFGISGTVGDNLQIASVTWTNSLGGGGAATVVGTAPAATWSASVYLFPGDNDITVTAADGHGQTATDVVRIQFTPESVDPTIVITGPSAGGSAVSPTQLAVVSGTADDNVGIVDVSWRNLTTRVRGAAVLAPPGGGPVVTWSADVPLANGDNLIVVTATDDAGNTATDTLTISFAAPSDAINPAITISGPTLLDVYDSSVSPLLITVAATDNVGVAAVAWSNASTSGNGTGTLVAGSTWTVSVALAVGANTVTVTAVDPAGNTAVDQLIVNFTPPPGDIAAPTVLITSHPTAATLGVSAQPLTLGGTGSDNVALAGVVWLNTTAGTGGGAEGTAAWTADVTLVPGINLITMRAYDTSGNTDTDVITVLYDPPPPPPEHVGAGNCGLTGLEILALLALVRYRPASRRRTSR